jgi:hypothetical protein
LREERRLRVFENRALKIILWSEWGDVTGEWRTLLNEELYALYSTPNIIQVMKSRRMRWARHVARMGDSRSAYRVLVGKPKGKRGKDGRIILIWIFKKWDGGHGLQCSHSG